MFQNFDAILNAVKTHPEKRVAAVASAEDESVIRSIIEAKKDHIADAILIGDAKKIAQLLQEQNCDPTNYMIEDAPAGQTGQRAVELVQSGQATFLMKGNMETREMLKPVVSKSNRLRTGRVMSHMAFNQLPCYHKLIVNTDGGMIVHPTLEDKKHIIENATCTLRSMGYEKPKFAVLAGIEKVDPKVSETVEADQLKQMNLRGELPNCIVEGPLSYDVAMSAKIAEKKGVDCLCCGDFDVLVQPSLAAGNIMGKTWTVSLGALMAGIIVGAKVPVVVVSRGASAKEKYFSMALAALVSTGCQE